ncbi:carbon monoxide dehydrogenase subunit G [Lichenihabitans sp. PAMC28606]|uniref:SRPBCC family protein n=1 Tax=Lichenihabitans sp. PAMC28606 TaxID=2880932 RepID=UPI001D0B0068|nr:carbon monoxide dehydrogenase subunit G [Lichenihabitans sp. PAMC28606]UDL94022.1 carbon monoxide dehydrogenase subunit G [Lichenihabitans sp. PAMC28606]
MDMTGSQRIEASRDVVYAALNDVDILRQCIPGCQTIEKMPDGALKATVKLKIGPMSVQFAGAVTLSDLDPPNGYTISGEGSGGIAGFAKGRAAVRLDPDVDATLLHYDVKAEIGGKLAQLGSRLIDGTAKKLAAEFFAKLGAIVGTETTPAAPAEPEPEPQKKAGWFSKAIGTASALAIAGTLLIPSCCLTHHAMQQPTAFPICHADGGIGRTIGL